MNIAYNMDCLKAMSEMPDKYYDLAVVDPPYGDGTGGNPDRFNGSKFKKYNLNKILRYFINDLRVIIGIFFPLMFFHFLYVFFY